MGSYRIYLNDENWQTDEESARQAFDLERGVQNAVGKGPI